MPLRMEVPAAGAEGAGDFGDLPDAGVFPQTWDDTSGVRAGGDVVCWRPTICSAQRSRWRRARLRARSGFATRFNPRPACRYALSDSLSPLPARVQWGHARLDAVAAFYQQDFAAGATGEPLLAVRVAVCHVKGRLLCDVCPNRWLCAWLYAMSRAACSATSAQTSCSARAQGCPAQLPDPILSGTEQRRLGRSCAAQPRTVAPRRSCACSCSSPAALQLLLWGRHACCSCRNALVSAMQPRCEARHASLTHPHARWACTSRMLHFAAG